MALRIKRLVDDITYSWSAMSKSQALRWYGSILRHAPTVWKQKKFYAADRDMVGDIRFRMFGKEFSVDTAVLSERPGNPPYSFYRELFVGQIYVDFLKMDIEGRSSRSFGTRLSGPGGWTTSRWRSTTISATLARL